MRDNRAIGSTSGIIRGGGIAAWDGTTEIDQSWITANQSDFGGGLFFCGIAGGTISRSTISSNEGGGLHSHSDTDIEVNDSTFSGNSGGLGAIFNGKTDVRPGFCISLARRGSQTGELLPSIFTLGQRRCRSLLAFQI